MKGNFIFSIRLQFFLTFLLSAIIGFFVFLILNGLVRNQPYNFSREIESFHTECQPVVEDLLRYRNDDHKVQSIIDEQIGDYDIFITNKVGSILLKPTNSQVAQLYIDRLINTDPTNTNITNIGTGTWDELIYNKLEKLDELRYIVITKHLLRNDEVNFMYIGIFIFLVMFFSLSYGKINYIKRLSEGLKQISTGNLDCRVMVKGQDEITILANNINNMVYELKKRKIMEENAERTKDELIANVSHDLKTPLTSIIGYTGLLKDGYKREDSFSKYINIIDEKSQRMKLLIEELFEYTMLTSGAMMLDKEEVSINELLRQIVEGMMPICMNDGISLNYCTPENEIITNVDPAKLARVMENITQNAMKYSSKPGEITISLNKEKDRTVIGVFNKGKNIEEEKLTRLFDRFYRTDEARNSKTGGAGLGLSIAKSIIELHGGRIWAENGGEGIWFYIALS